MIRDFKGYKSGADGEPNDEKDEVETEDVDIEETDSMYFDNFTMFYKKEENPNDLMEYILRKISYLDNINYKQLSPFKIVIGKEADVAINENSEQKQEEDFLAGNELNIQNNSEIELEIKKYNDGHVIEFDRLYGSKYDFYVVYNQLHKCLA